MAINMVTGLPGNAKTLYTIGLVKKLAEEENRPVYYNGIKDCLIPGWIEMPDPTKWMDCPTGSIIFMDEAQKTFRNRSIGASPPLHVTELEEHRHRGVDFFVISQHPSLLDPALRRLTQSHRHMIRIWGMEASTVHLWNGVRDNCDKSSARVDSEKTKYAFDKSLYGMYHSADKHTMKRKIPFRVKMLLVLPLLLVAAGWYVSQKVMKKPVTPNAAHTAQNGVQSLDGQSVPVGRPSDLRGLPLAAVDPVADARAYLAMRQPRVEGLPETAPRYDELTKPVRVPVPAACIQVGAASDSKEIKCNCYSQQGTRMDVRLDMCIGIARNGAFRDFDPDVQKKNEGEAVASSASVPPSGNTGGKFPAVAVIASASGEVATRERAPALAQPGRRPASQAEASL